MVWYWQFRIVVFWVGCRVVLYVVTIVSEEHGNKQNFT